MSGSTFWHFLNELHTPQVVSDSAAPQVAMHSIDYNLPAVRRCNVTPQISEALRAHVVERQEDPNFHFYGRPGRKWIALARTHGLGHVRVEQ